MVSPFPTVLAHWRSESADAVIAIPPSLWQDQKINSQIPAAESEEFKDGVFRFHYGPLKAGETLCLAGESGSGKSVTSLSIMRLLPRTSLRIASGRMRAGMASTWPAFR